MKVSPSKEVYVLGAGYSGLTTAAELSIRGYAVRIVAESLGYMPPLTIVGTQSRRWPGSALRNQLFDFEDLLGNLLYQDIRSLSYIINNNIISNYLVFNNSNFLFRS